MIVPAANNRPKKRSNNRMAEDPLPRTGRLRYLPVASPATGHGPANVPRATRHDAALGPAV
jgi:hypothetical protein